MLIESVMPSNHLILCTPLHLLPSNFPSIRVFSNESVLCIRWPKYWSFSFSISPSDKYSGLISFRMDWLDLLAVQGTLKSLLQHHGSKASVLYIRWPKYEVSALASVLPMNIQDWFILWWTGWISLQSKGLSKVFSNTTVPKAWTFVGKVMSLLFNMLSRFVTAFLLKNESFNFTAPVIICSDFGAQENKVCHCFYCFPIYLPWSDGTGYNWE